MAKPIRGCPPAVLLTIGDELLLGDRVDTNARWLAEALTHLSFEVREILSVGDDEEEIGAALARSESRAAGGIVIVTGGLGPTLDDRTREAAARHRKVALEEDPAVLEVLTARFRERGYAELPTLNRRIARVPRGARVLPNPAGSAPGLELPAVADGAVVVLLPGVPAEMKAIFEGSIMNRLDILFPERPAPPAVETIRTSGIPESELAARLEACLGDHAGVKLQYRPSVEGVELRFSVEGPAADARLRSALVAADSVLAPWRFGGRDTTLAEATLAACRGAGWRLAVAESCTGGMLGAALTAVPGSSDVVVGGVIAYDNRLKTELLGVSPSLLDTNGAVSEAVAGAMAYGACGRLGADIAVSITGVAGPGGGSENRPVGLVWFGLCRPGEPARARSERFPGTREEIRRRAVQYALRWVRMEALEAGQGAGPGEHVDSRSESVR